MDATTADLIGTLILVGLGLIALALCLWYWAAKHRSDNQVKIAQEETKQAKLNAEAAETNLGIAIANVKAAELNARSPQDHS